MAQALGFLKASQLIFETLATQLKNYSSEEKQRLGFFVVVSPLNLDLCRCLKSAFLPTSILDHKLDWLGGF